MILMKSGTLSDIQFTGLAYAALLLGGQAWTSLAKTVQEKDSYKELIQRLQGPLQASGLPADIASWIINKCELLEP